MTALDLDPQTTALVVIDLQRGIVARPATPYPASDIVQRCARLADRFRQTNWAGVAHL